MLQPIYVECHYNVTSTPLIVLNTISSTFYKKLVSIQLDVRTVKTLVTLLNLMLLLFNVVRLALHMYLCCVSTIIYSGAVLHLTWQGRMVTVQLRVC